MLNNTRKIFRALSTSLEFKINASTNPLKNKHLSNKLIAYITQGKYDKVPHKALNYASAYYFSEYPTHAKLTMPALSPTMKKGKILKWNKSVGDKVEPGDVLCEVETDKASVGFEMQESGYVAKILIPEGANDVEVGSLVAILAEEASDVSKFQDYGESSTKSNAPAEAVKSVEEHNIKGTKRTNISINFQRHAEPSIKTTTPSHTQKIKIDLPRHTKLTMPALSPTMQKGTIKKWTKNVGDKLSPGDVIADVETDKATVGFEMQDEGYLAKILVPEGSTDVPVGQIVAVIVDEPSNVKDFKDYTGETESASSSTQAEKPTSQQEIAKSTQEVTKQANRDGERVLASPAAKRVAQELNTNLNDIKGSGPQHRVLKHDVEEFNKLQQIKTPHVIQPQSIIKEQEAKPDEKLMPKPIPPSEPKTVKPLPSHKDAEYEEIPITNMREVIAQRLLESKLTVPHYYLQMEINMDNLIKAREELNKHSPIKISFNDYFIKAASLACLDVPEVNSQWHGKVIRKYKNADISVAVDTGKGLITPIIKAANLKGIAKISAEVKELAEKSKKNALKPEEFIGGTFTISNLGMFGITNFAAVINPPQSCILAVGKTDKVLQENPEKPDSFKVVNVLRATLSCDHRVVDGAVGARWIQRFKNYLENPLTMLL